MPTEKWTAATDRSTVLTTQLNSLADAASSGLGTELDNTSNKDRFAEAELNVTYGTNPTAGSVVDLYCVPTRDGTNYPDVTTTVIANYWVGAFVLAASTSAQRAVVGPFQLPGPLKMKFLAVNRAGQTMAASGNTVSVSTFNRDIS